MAGLRPGKLRSLDDEPHGFLSGLLFAPTDTGDRGTRGGIVTSASWESFQRTQGRLSSAGPVASEKPRGNSFTDKGDGGICGGIVVVNADGAVACSSALSSDLDSCFFRVRGVRRAKGRTTGDRVVVDGSCTAPAASRSIGPKARIFRAFSVISPGAQTAGVLVIDDRGRGSLLPCPTDRDCCGDADVTVAMS